MSDPARVEARTQEIGRRLLEAARREHEQLTTLNRWTRQVLSWCLADPHVKGQVLRFIDTLPSLRTSRAVAQHVREYFSPEVRLPAALRLGSAAARPGLVTARVVSAMVHQLVEQVAKQFIAGTTPEDAAQVVTRLASQGGLLASFDVLGEQVLSESESDRYAQRYLTLIRQLGRDGHVSIKPSSLSSRTDPLAFEDSVERIAARLVPIATTAADIGAAIIPPSGAPPKADIRGTDVGPSDQRQGVGITLDMEQYELRDLTLEVAKRVLREPALGERVRLGIVIQAYLRDSESVVEDLLAWLRQHRRRLAVRLVRGAYWDAEVGQASQRGWEPPVFLAKGETDAAFERLTATLLGAPDAVQAEIGTHNVRSIANAMAVADAGGVAKEGLEFQFLYGMGDAIQAAVRQLGYRVRVYAPLGALIPGMAYLVRRILENTANESFLRQDFLTGAPEDMLRPPQASAHGTRTAIPSRDDGMDEPFANFAVRAQRDAFAGALDEVRREMGRSCPLLVAGEAVQTTDELHSVNPAHPDQVIGRAACAGPSEVDRAVAAARASQRRWGSASVEDRVACLLRAADLLRRRRWWFAALEVLEVGKPWREADADVVEAIEYLEYYGAQMRALARGAPLPQRLGESSRLLYRPRGICAVIAPWNFPLAILTGMSSAALAAGNAVILKPAEQSPVIAYHYARLLHEAGVPPDVAQYLPGRGETTGKALVEHPEVAVVMFTGSKAIGLSIVQAAARVAQGQRFIKHVVTEMGGKNALIVDEDADLDAALKGALASAFGYQGQKCSALSRLIVHEAVYAPLLERLAGAADRLVVGDPADPGCDVGPLIDAAARQRLQSAAAQARKSATVVYRYPDSRLPREGFFVGPSVCADVDPSSTLAKDELFGPLLCVFRAKNFADALAMANDSEYALTGGIYSRSPSHLRQAVQELEAGNLYLNRPITGALVGRQPFGGYKLSGLGTKAGGPDYLLQLLIPKTICENTTRHGMPLE